MRGVEHFSNGIHFFFIKMRNIYFQKLNKNKNIYLYTHILMYITCIINI